MSGPTATRWQRSEPAGYDFDATTCNLPLYASVIEELAEGIRRSSRIIEPIKTGIRDAKLGLGKQEQDDYFTAEENIQRRKLDIEVEKMEELAKKREKMGGDFHEGANCIISEMRQIAETANVGGVYPIFVIQTSVFSSSIEFEHAAPMLIKTDHPSSAAPAPTKCGNCGAEERRLLHHVRHSGSYRQLCTNCVLRLHPHCFCPTCFQVYPPNPSNDAILTCCKCFSASHSHCVTAPYPSPYMCPLCANPNTPLFQLKPLTDELVDISSMEELRVMDRDAAKKLLAAAKIATFSMNKAAGVARLEAEKKAKEAALARKRAREALEHVAFLVVKEKSRKGEEVLGAPIGGIDIGHAKRENNGNVVNSVHMNGVAGSGPGSSVVVDEKINVVGVADSVENSNQVVAELNTVELRENEKINAPTPEDVEFGVNADDDHVSVMDVDVDDSSVGVIVGGSVAERNIGRGNDHIMFSEGENSAENLSKQEDKNIHQIENGNERANGTQ